MLFILCTDRILLVDISNVTSTTRSFTIIQTITDPLIAAQESDLSYDIALSSGTMVIMSQAQG